MKIRTHLAMACAALVLSACSTFRHEADVSPLTQFRPTLAVNKLWSTSAGNGSGKQYLRLAPVVAKGVVFTASQNGVISATNIATGKHIWQYRIHDSVTAGLGAGAGLLFVGTGDGYVLAMMQNNGRILWKSPVSSQVLAAPTYARGRVFVKPEDGKVFSFAAHTGQKQWVYSQSTPNLILRGSSAPQVSRHRVIAGFANGTLVALSFSRGNVLWRQTIATPRGSSVIQRMVDIDDDPVIYNGVVYVATYQGRIAAVSLASGHILWQHKLSSYVGLAVDSRRVYVADANSVLYAYDKQSGVVLWRQAHLAGRRITAPVLYGKSVVVGDIEGYLHFIARDNGRFLQRVALKGRGMYAPAVVSHGRVLVYTIGGRLEAYGVA